MASAMRDWPMHVYLSQGGHILDETQQTLSGRIYDSALAIDCTKPFVVTLVRHKHHYTHGFFHTESLDGISRMGNASDRTHGVGIKCSAVPSIPKRRQSLDQIEDFIECGRLYQQLPSHGASTGQYTIRISASIMQAKSDYIYRFHYRRIYPAHESIIPHGLMTPTSPLFNNKAWPNSPSYQQNQCSAASLRLDKQQLSEYPFPTHLVGLKSPREPPREIPRSTWQSTNTPTDSNRTKRKHAGYEQQGPVKRPPLSVKVTSYTGTVRAAASSSRPEPRRTQSVVHL